MKRFSKFEACKMNICLTGILSKFFQEIRNCRELPLLSVDTIYTYYLCITVSGIFPHVYCRFLWHTVGTYFVFKFRKIFFHIAYSAFKFLEQALHSLKKKQFNKYKLKNIKIYNLYMLRHLSIYYLVAESCSKFQPEIGNNRDIIIKCLNVLFK